jgi:hypothetical protein
MDEQVDEILIKPLSRKRRDTEEPAPPPAPEPDPPNATDDNDETAVRHDELPVWML